LLASAEQPDGPQYAAEFNRSIWRHRYRSLATISPPARGDGVGKLMFATETRLVNHSGLPTDGMEVVMWLAIWTLA